MYKLLEGPLSLAGLKQRLNTTSPNIIPRLKELEENKLVFRKDGVYYLSPIGVITVKKLLQVDGLSSLIEGWRDFLNAHDLSPIPGNLLGRFDELEGCKLIENSMMSINAASTRVFDNLSNADMIKGITPVFDDYYPEFFTSMVRRGCQVALIITENIVEKMKTEYPDTWDLFLAHDNVNLYIVSDTRLVFYVTDISVSISLHQKEGDFDGHACLMGFDGSAIRWGEDLFEHYRKKSKRINA